MDNHPVYGLEDVNMLYIKVIIIALGIMAVILGIKKRLRWWQLLFIMAIISALLAYFQENGLIYFIINSVMATLVLVLFYRKME